MDRGLVGLAVAAGMVAALNPCGFAMLPAYLLLVVRGAGTRAPGVAAAGRALAATTGMALGFLTVFGLFGALTVSAAGAVQRWLPYATVVVGVLLVALGGWLLAGRSLSALTPRPVGPRWAPTARLGSMYGYGISYAIASLSCTVGPFLAVTAAGLRSGSLLTGAAVYLGYVAGLTLVVGVLAVAAATASAATADRLRRMLPFVDRISGAVLVLVGLYVAYYGGYEVRLFGAGGDPRDAVIGAAGRLQGALAGWVHRHGLWPWALALLALAAVLFGRARRRGRRADRLPDPAAAAAPQVADQHHEDQRRESDQKPVLDVADVVAAQHGQQQPEDDQADDVPGPVVDPAPSPRRRRHLDGVDAGEVLDLGTGHGESPSDRIGLSNPDSGTAAGRARGARPHHGPRRWRAAQ
ncbi:cytochrome C biosynthesis protein [Mycobacterium avium subsp. hominissuis A5]|nr:cytochrome C biosynthesis protein [Mycobacterium avium subsp. hominissuis A5]